MIRISHLTDKLTITSLLLFTLGPVVISAILLVNIPNGIGLDQDDARFFVNPIPLIIHLISSSLYLFFGAFQFSTSIRTNFPQWHRYFGRVLVVAGFVSASTALWMNQFYEPGEQDGLALYFLRILFSLLMLTFLTLGLISILRKDIQAHRAWMIRSYAVGAATGTMFFVGIAWFTLVGPVNVFGRAVMLGSCWLLTSLCGGYIVRHAARG